MSRRPVGARLPRGRGSLHEEVVFVRGVQSNFCPPDGLTESERPYVAPVHDYVWDKDARRYRWRRGMIKDGKNLSWHFHPVPISERKLYEQRIRSKKADKRIRTRRP